MDLRTPPAAPPTGTSPGSSRRPYPAAGAVRVLWALAGAGTVLAVVLAAALVADPRALATGEAVWVKPFKFALSLALFHATLAWVAERLAPEVQRGVALRATVAVLAVATAGEMAYIAGRASVARPSHFAVGTPLEALAYTLMAVGATLLVLGVAVVGALAARDRRARFGPGLRAGVVIGLPLSTALTLVTAFTLGGNGGHHVGVPEAGVAALPLVGWSAAVGDLRPAHFLALHAMQALPLAGLAWDAGARRFATDAPAGLAWRSAVALALVWTALTAAVYAQALMGLPLIRL